MFTNKVVLVTGGSRGIGAAICRMFAKQGAKVYINYASSEDKAKTLKKEIEYEGGLAECFQADVANADSVKTMFKYIENRDGKLDILVNNAGIKHDALMASMNDIDWNKVIHTNLSSAFYCSKAAVRLMISQNSGVVINISSVSGLIGIYGQANYSSAKAGLIALTKTMAKELGKLNIRVNTVAPGFIETDMLKTMNQISLNDMISSIPLARVGTVEEVSNVVQFIASENASYINGQCIVVDGGLSS